MPGKKFIGANIKMNPLPKDLACYKSTTNADVVIFPSFLDLEQCIAKKLVTGAQWGHPNGNGAATGDVSMTMLKTIGATHVLCGHSERRKNHGESDTFVTEQVHAAMDNGLVVILCIGEMEAEHAMKKTNEIVKRQLKAVTDRCKLTADQCIIAYEPVWAIGSGKTPTMNDIQSIHRFIRSLLPDVDIRILYGGSVNAQNASEIFGCDGVDGALVGGASLDPQGFKKIVDSAISS